MCTTALREFWDFSNPLVLFGDGCIRYSERKNLESFSFTVLEDPISSGASLRRVIQAVDNAYENILKLLGGTLNSLHDEDMSERYWRIVLGPWLHFYLASLLDRWCWVISALEKYPYGTSVGLSRENFIIPRDSLHHTNLLKGDYYNLQLYSQLFEFLGLSFVKLNSSLTKSILEKKSGNNCLSEFAKTIVRKTINYLVNKAKPEIIITASDFSRWQEMQLFFRTFGTISRVYKPPPELPEIPIDNVLRSRLAALLPESTDFMGAALEILPAEMPQSFIEGYKHIRNFAQRDFPKSPKAIYSSNSYWYDEVFKQWAGRCAEKGAKILTAQHGNHAGSMEWFPYEQHEIAISDRYYTWGWDNKSSGYSQKIVPMVAPKLTWAVKSSLYDHNSKGNILMAVTSDLRFGFYLNGRPSQTKSYLDWQLRFITSLSKETQLRLKIRQHQEDFGWDVTNRLRDSGLNLKIDADWSTPFLTELGNCSLFICDHLGTTLLESFAAGKPSVFFFDPARILLREEAKSYYNGLIRVGVLFHDPIEAANAVNLIANDPESWWQDHQRQNAVQHFTERFARASKDAAKFWVRELISVTRDKR